MSTTLPKTIMIESTKGDTERPVLALGSTSVPDHDGGSYAAHLGVESRADWDGWYRERVKPHLLSWSFPAEVRAVKDRCEAILEDGIPSQRRTMLRNQSHGQLDSRWVPQIAIGADLERPFQRWSRAKRDTISVAICLDSTVACFQSAEMLKARMSIAAGLAGALEFLDYDTAIIGAHVQISMAAGGSAKPRQKPESANVVALTCKDWNEPFADSGLANMADTGLRRLVCCWQMQSNGYCTQLSDREWRDLTGADLLIFVGPTKKDSRRDGFGGRSGWGQHVINTEGLPAGSKIGPDGEDTLHLGVDSLSDLEPAMDALSAFFQERFGD